ncbi:hypothetical protein BGY98DRAFT_29794 [Russula aff. rugulosa BPL654]|nr:hypothetical protein BGY98DRAFT_29794 [Russula aff. rugulosa BPL654]
MTDIAYDDERPGRALSTLCVVVTVSGLNAFVLSVCHLGPRNAMPRLGTTRAPWHSTVPLPNRRWQITNFVPSLVQKPRLTFESPSPLTYDSRNRFATLESPPTGTSLPFVRLFTKAHSFHLRSFISEWYLFGKFGFKRSPLGHLQYLYTSINQAVSISRLCMHCTENVTITVEQISISILSLFSKPPAYPF